MLIDAEAIDNECRTLAENAAKRMINCKAMNPIKETAVLLKEMRELSGRYPQERVMTAVTAYFDTFARYGIKE